MPQEIRVVHCFDCKMFQSDIVKKAMKWQCKLCGANQTMQKEYFRGTGAECRTKVQQLNMAKGHQAQENINNVMDLRFNKDCDWNEVEGGNKINGEESPIGKTSNKWLSYVDSCHKSNDNASTEISMKNDGPNLINRPNELFQNVTEQKSTKEELKDNGQQKCAQVESPMKRNSSIGMINKNKGMSTPLHKSNTNKWSRYLDDSSPISLSANKVETATVQQSIETADNDMKGYEIPAKTLSINSVNFHDANLKRNHTNNESGKENKKMSKWDKFL